MCNNCNTRALFTVSVVASIISEVCFLPVLILIRLHIETRHEGDEFCWNWLSGPDDKTCPFLALFLVTLLTGILLVCTALHIVLSYCRPQCGQNRAFFKHLFRFGAFAVNLVVSLLALVFVGLVIGFSFSGENLNYTGYLLKGGDIHSHYHFILICIGTIASVIATVSTAVLAFKPRRPAARDEFGDSIFQSFIDHGTTDYQEIN